MAIDIIARGLATSLIGPDGRVDSTKMPIIQAPAAGGQFYPLGGLTSVDQIDGKTVEEILMTILFGMMQPTITAPSFGIQLLSATNVIAFVEQEVKGILVFDQGEIRVPNGTLMARAGAPTNYMVNDLGIASSSNSVDFTITLLPTLGENVITASVTFEEGPQPVDSLGNPFDAPYPAGSLTANVTITGISSLTTADNQSIEFDYLDFGDGIGYHMVAVAETDNLKQSFKILSATPVLGIKQFNPLSQAWEWIGGSAEASLKTFDTTIIQGESPEDTYIVYTHNGSIKGRRELRLYTTLS